VGFAILARWNCVKQVSRKGAKNAKLAKKTPEFDLAALCAFAALREMF
jgi:hypothetical protein